MRPLYIFDLDGTLANCEHRLPILKDMTNSHRWRDFYDASVDDSPNEPVINILSRLRSTGCEIWVFSGRTEEVRHNTETWLRRHAWFLSSELETALMMRPAGDTTPDHELKKLWLDRMLIEDRQRLVAVFDDRDRVVQMWRDNGITCLQVQPGNF